MDIIDRLFENKLELLKKHKTMDAVDLNVDLKGLRLTPISPSFINNTAYFTVDLNNSENICFRFDGCYYCALEDPQDGYRSTLNDIFILDGSLAKNVFATINVDVAVGDEMLQVFDSKNNKLVLEVGTDYDDCCYPCFVADFNPKNMSINTEHKID